LDGNAVISDQDAVREIVAEINARRPGENAVRAGDVNAIGLIDEIWHYMVRFYRRAKRPGTLGTLEKHLERTLGAGALDGLRLAFVEEFPGSSVVRGGESPQAYLAGKTAGQLNRRRILEEMLMLGLANRNPAFSVVAEFFDESPLENREGYRRLMDEFRAFFRTQPGFGRGNKDLVSFLVEPIVAAPHSLSDQLEYIYRHWGEYLNEELLGRLLVGRDIIREEEKERRDAGGGPGGAAETAGAGLPLPGGGAARGYPEDYEAFSPDLDWMPRVVLMVKNIHVWLDQLSRKYGRRLSRLDHVPDEELDLLRDRGFTALWLIGIWEKSRVSRTIKQTCGNPDAGASAYSLYDYAIAGALGGEEALRNLKSRAIRRGVRMASDMVPNHTGIYSRWVVEHPDWFVQLRVPPFPGYGFNGPNLSEDPRISVYIEDGYWTRTDAAVVFKRVDRLTGDVRYLYHGNDGTNMPWNDTAQLDYLKREVREAVIRTIIHVARSFPIIRFDAAMVLTKKHFQRLWYPPPGSGGDIPSRAGRGLSPAEFNRRFPKEFWREVVDRVAAEVPDTLLLAEAFWLLEGYFVRTLGMHRVYNSAFMNMLKMENNSQYRTLLKDFLEFEPQILKRFVNFMSNPDEATAAEGFGDGDKYFGVCSLMATLPGLPLFGHGQIEGFREKYGMEFLRATQAEPVNRGLVQRHEREIFPLLKKRYLFSDVANFVLYDFFRETGAVDENVFAYSNRHGAERALVLYHNLYADTAGWIRVSAAQAEKRGGRKTGLRQSTLAEGLSLRTGEEDFTLFRELRSGLEYIRSSRELQEKGFFTRLGPYQVKVFADFRVIRDGPERALSALERNLRGRGVPNLDHEIRKLHFGPLHAAFRSLYNRTTVEEMLAAARESRTPDEYGRRAKAILDPVLTALFAAASGYGGGIDEEAVGTSRRALEAIFLLEGDENLPGWTSSRYSRPALRKFLELRRLPGAPPRPLGLLMLWSCLREVIGGGRRNTVEVSRMKKWYLDELVIEFLEELGGDWSAARDDLDLLTIMLAEFTDLRKIKTKNHLYLFAQVFRDDVVRRYLRFNWYADTLWFDRESLSRMVFWLFATSVLEKAAAGAAGEAPRVKGLVLYRAAGRLETLAEAAGFKVKEFIREIARARAPRRRAAAAARKRKRR